MWRIGETPINSPTSENGMIISGGAYMSPNRFLEGSKVYLNPIKEADIPFLAGFMNDEHIRIFGRNNGSIVYEEKMKERMLDKQKSDELFGIYRIDTDTLIGDASLNDIDVYNRSAMVGIIINGDENRGNGFGQDAVKLLLKHAFIDLNLESVSLGTWDFNIPAKHVYEKLGFKLVGKRRRGRIVGNRYHDEIIMDMIAEEYFDMYGNDEMKKYGFIK
jgi:RimJ/RimL family protein N-acetyltransferase